VASPTTIKGNRAEQTAATFLQQQGYRVLERNYRCRRGEIDIVAEEGEVLCFVEVRSTESRAFGDPLETIGEAKQARIIRAARHYLATRRVGDRQVRFDVVGIVYQPSLEIQLVRGAFETSSWW
jgi:putative endonuclease